MKTYKLDRDDLALDCTSVDYDNENIEDYKIIIKPGLTSWIDSDDVIPLGDFSNEICTSKESLIDAISEYLDDNFGDISKVVIPKILKLANIVYEEIKYPDKPCIIVKCSMLNDQYECDACRKPMLYLNSMTELDKLNIKYKYEVYTIGKNGKLNLSKKYSTYKNF